jgi:two-component system, NtrC family, response regulator AtoC
MILIVDDDPTFLKEAEEVLAPERDLLFLTHGREAVQFVKDIGVSVVIVDLSLGEESGFDLIRNLRSTAPKLPIIAMSGVYAREVLESALLLGANEVLSKPATPAWKKVVERVRQMNSSVSGNARTAGAA